MKTILNTFGNVSQTPKVYENTCVISCGRRSCSFLFKSGLNQGAVAGAHVPPPGVRRLIKGQTCMYVCVYVCVCVLYGGGNWWMLTIWVHMVPWHLWGCEPLLERVCAVTVLIHGDQLLLRGSQRREGVHHPLHAIRHHLCKANREAVMENVF